MRRIIAVIAAVSLLFLAACSSKDKESPSDSKEPLKVGMELAYPPFETKDASGNPSGVSVELAKAFGQSLGREVEIVDTSWDGLIPSLQSHKVDMVISSMTITAERGEVVDFSDPYAKAYLAFLVGEKSDAQSADDLAQPGRVIAVKKGTTGETFVKEHMKGADRIALASENAAVTEVAQGKADAFIYDQLTIYRQSQEHPGSKMFPINDQDPQEWGAAFAKDNTELRDKFNEFLKTYSADNGFDKLTEQFLPAEKQKFDELGFPWFFG